MVNTREIFFVYLLEFFVYLLEFFTLYNFLSYSRLLFCDILQTNKTYMKDLTVIQPEMLLEAAPHFYESTSIKSV